MKRVLLHACCGPCAVMCVEALREEGLEPSLLWYNPNIHPYTEYVLRRDSLSTFAAQAEVEVSVLDEYGLRPFLAAMGPDVENRCAVCYSMRMDRVAHFAAENGFECFATTLLISPYQKYEQIIEAGERAAKAHGVAFFERDFRPLFREGQRAAKEMGLYRQKYCGCIFSEEERFSGA